MSAEIDAGIRNNTLLLDGEPLNAEHHGPEDINKVLTNLGRDAILASIKPAEEEYKQALSLDPETSSPVPSILVMSLGHKEQNIFTILGRRNKTGTHRSELEVSASFRPHWDAITSHEFNPVITSGQDTVSKTRNWLMLRNPETDPFITPLDALPAALGYVELPEVTELRPMLREAYANGNSEAARELWTEVADVSRDAVDEQSKIFKAHDLRWWRGNDAAARVGRDIAEAIMRVEIIGDAYLLDPDRYEDALSDIHDHVKNLSYEKYYYQMSLDAVGEKLKQEVARVRSLRT